MSIKYIILLVELRQNESLKGKIMAYNDYTVRQWGEIGDESCKI